jgi:glutamine amidotransferase/cyclase
VWVSSIAAAAGHALADHTHPTLGRGARGPNGETLCWYECTLQGGRKGSNLDVVQVSALFISFCLCNSWEAV